MIDDNSSLLHRAKRILNDIGFSCGNEYNHETDLLSFKCIDCFFNGINCVIETDFWYQEDTIVRFIFQLAPDQKVEIDSELDKRIDSFINQIQSLSYGSALIERDYGQTHDENNDWFPQFPTRKSVGTRLLVEFVLGSEPEAFEKKNSHEVDADLKSKLIDAVNFAALVHGEIKSSQLL